MNFWPTFCANAGVFCMGEVFGGIDVEWVHKCLPFLMNSIRFIHRSVAMYQGPQSLDSVLNYPMYTALVAGFQLPGPGNMSAIADTFEQSKLKYTVSCDGHKLLYHLTIKYSGHHSSWQFSRESRSTPMAKYVG